MTRVLFATDVRNRFFSLFTYLSTKVLSVKQTDVSKATSNSCLIIVSKRTAVVAAESFSPEIFLGFTGANLDFPVTKLQLILP